MLVQLNNKSSLGMSRTICESVLFTEVPGDVAPVLLTNLRELRLHEKESIPQDKELLTTDVCPPCLHRSVNSFFGKTLNVPSYSQDLFPEGWDSEVLSHTNRLVCSDRVMRMYH